MINPVQDSDLSVELSLVANNLNLCLSTMVMREYQCMYAVLSLSYNHDL